METLFGELVVAVELLPELFLSWHGGLLREFHVAQVKRIKNSQCCLVALVAFQVRQLARLDQHEQGEGRAVGQTDEALKCIRVVFRDLGLVNGSGEQLFEGVFTVVLPDALEVRFTADLFGLLVREDAVFLLDQLGCHFSQSVKFSLESSFAFRGGCVHAKDHLSVLVGVRERVKQLLLLRLIVIFAGKVTLLAVPGRLGNLVVEHA